MEVNAKIYIYLKKKHCLLSLWCFVMQYVGELCIFFCAEQSVDSANVGISKGESSSGAQICQAAISLCYYTITDIAR